MKFPEFWYESNACWGNVKSFNDLAEKARIQLEEPNSIRTLDDFLNMSLKTRGEVLNFGTRREHTSILTLREFLLERGILDDFLSFWQNGN